jgi:hypothetical protein
MNKALRDEGKVVYVLGAGFSILVGAPTQAQILGDIFSLDVGTERVEKAKARLQDFLEKELRIKTMYGLRWRAWAQCVVATGTIGRLM